MIRSAVVMGSLALLFGSLAMGQRNAASGAPGAEALPRVVVSGLESYRKDGPVEAVKAWVKDGVLEADPEALAQAGVLRQAQAAYGAYRGFHVISVRELSGSTTVVLLTLDYEKGPMFAKFVAYRTQPGSVLTNMVFKTDEEAVVPACP